MARGSSWRSAVLFTITSQTGGLDNASIAALDLRTQTSTILVRGGLDAHYEESGHLVYVAAGTLRAVPFDLGRLAVRGPAVPVVPRLVTTRSGAGEFGIARDGTLVYVDVTPGSQSARARTLVWVDRTGKEERIAAPTRSYEGPRISPDGKQLALAITDQESDIWVWDVVRGGDLRRLTFYRGVDTFPVWTPDSHRIVYSSQSGGALNLWLKAANETGPAEQLTTSANVQWPTSISSDGKQVVLTELTPTTGRDLMLLTLDGSHRVTPLLQTPFDELRGAISPDGHWLAYESNSSGQFEIWVQAVSEHQCRRISDFDLRRHATGLGPQWQGAVLLGRGRRPDGRTSRSHADDVECLGPEKAARAALLHRRRKSQSFVRCLARRPTLSDDQSGERRSTYRPTSSSSSTLTRS